MPSVVINPNENLPNTQTAIKQGPGGALSVSKNAPLPLVEAGTVLIRPAAVGLNPTDYKMPSSFPTPGATAGCDFAGTVVAVGDDVAEWQVGDCVLGAVHGSNPLEKTTGAFAEYVRADADMVTRVPDGMSWEQAAALGAVGHGTVAIALWMCLGLKGKPASPLKPGSDSGIEADEEDDSNYVLVYGGSTATGTMAIQLLRLSGYKPIAVCSRRNFALARSFGAFAVFDYMSATCGTDIRSYTHNALWHVLDCISDKQSAQVCYAAVGRAGGQYVCLELQPPEALASRKAVTSEFLMGYDMFGKRIALPGEYGREANEERHVSWRKWCVEMSRLLAEDKIKSHPIKVLEGGWQSIIDGLELLRKGEVSGTKLVVRMT